MSATTKFTIALLMSAVAVEAAIVETGPWTGKDWVQSNAGYKYTNGIVSSTDANTQRRIKAPNALPEHKMSDWQTKKNVKLVDSLVGNDNWNHWFSLADTDAGLTYQNFLKSVAKFPYFCNEWNEKEKGLNTESLENTCKRELATLFAHIAYESGQNDPWNTQIDKYRQGLAFAQNPDCGDDDNEKCDHIDSSTRYPARDGAQYYSRGPLAILGNVEYGGFSEAFGPIKYDSKNRFLEDPDEITEDGYIAFASALWFYMTPRGFNPSMHDVMTKYWMPGGQDNGIESGFGATISIINGKEECGLGYDSHGSAARYVYFQNFLTDFGLYAGEGGQSCAMNWHKTFPYGGEHNSKPQWFVKGDWNKPGTCKAVLWESPYNVYVEDDYKRCVCDSWGKGADDCKAEEIPDDGDDDDQDDQSEGEKTDDEKSDDDQDDEQNSDQDNDDDDKSDEDQDEDNDQSDEDQDDEEQSEEDQDDDDKSDEDQEDDDKSDEDQDDDDQSEEDQDDDDKSDEDQDDDDKSNDQNDNDEQSEEDQDDDDQSEEDQDDDDKSDEDQDDDNQSDDENDTDDESEENNEDEDESDEDKSDDESDKTPLDLDNEVSQMFEKIWKEMHYDEENGDLSRTLYQVDSSLDFIEDILIKFDAILAENGLYLEQN